MSTPAGSSSKRFLVTAGNTRERIDSVRDWGNIFTGNTGLAIARALTRLGEVDLLTSNRAHLAELESASEQPASIPRDLAGARIHASAFTSHAELKGALGALLARYAYAGVFMTAAVADYRPAGVYEIVERRPIADGRPPGGGTREAWVVRDVQAGKVKSTHPAIAVVGTPTEKLVDLFRTAWGYRGLLVKFKLEVGIPREELLRVGDASRRASDADYLVANTLDMVEGDKAGAFLIGATGHEWVPRGELPERLVRVGQDRGWLGRRRQQGKNDRSRASLARERLLHGIFVRSGRSPTHPWPAASPVAWWSARSAVRPGGSSGPAAR